MKNENISGIIVTSLFFTFIITLPLIWADKQMLDASLLPRQLSLSVFTTLIAIIFLLFTRRNYSYTIKKDEKIITGGILLFMVMHIISCINATNAHEAFFHTIKEYTFCTFGYLTYRALRLRHLSREVLTKAITVTSLIFIIIGYYQLFKSDFSNFISAKDHFSYYLNLIMDNVFSTCSNKNLFASLLFITLPFGVYNTLKNKNGERYSTIWRIISIITVISNIGLIILSLSRTVYVAFFVFIALCIVLLYIHILCYKPMKTGETNSTKKKTTLILIPTIILLSIYTFAKTTDTQIEKTITERIGLTFNPQKYGYKDNEHGESSVAMRTLIWGKTIEMIKNHPVIGFGPGQWQIIIPKYGVDEFNENLRNGTLTFQRPHNDFLWIAAETGILGLIGYLIFIITTISISIANIKKSTDNNIVTFNILAVSAIIGWIIISCLDYPHERIEHNIIFITLCTLILSDGIQYDTNETLTAKKSKTPTVMTLTICTIISIISIKQTQQFIKGESNSRQIIVAQRMRNWPKMLQLTKNANKNPYTINNMSVPTNYYRGIALSMTNNNENAIQSYSNALKMHPYHILTLCAKGSLLLKLEKYDDAIECLLKALEISPRCDVALFNTAIAYYNKKDFKNALNYILRFQFDNTKNKPDNFQKAYLTICKHAVFDEKDLYNQENLAAWLKNDNRIIASIRKFHAGNHATLSEVLIPELGPKGN